MTFADTVVCRRCGRPLGARFRFGSNATGWEHMEGECEPTPPAWYSITVSPVGPAHVEVEGLWWWTIRTDRGTVAADVADSIEGALGAAENRLLIYQRTGT